MNTELNARRMRLTQSQFSLLIGHRNVLQGFDVHYCISHGLGLPHE